MSMILNGDSLHVIYDSLEEFESQLPSLLTVNKYMADESLYVWHKHENVKWFGDVGGAASVMQKVKSGWPEMYDRLLKMWGTQKPEVQLSASTVQVRRRKRRRGDYGDTLDMHRVWSGELDRAWERPVREYRLGVTQRHATIYIDTGISAAEDADNVLWRAAAALTMCDLLQAAGRSVEIYVGSSTHTTYRSYSSPNFCWTAMRVKSYTQPLNPERLTAMVTAGFHRTYSFLMKLATPYQIAHNLGFSLNRGLPIQLTERAEGGELVVRLGHCTSRQQADRELENVRKMLAKESAIEEAV